MWTVVGHGLSETIGPLQRFILGMIQMNGITEHFHFSLRQQLGAEGSLFHRSGHHCKATAGQCPFSKGTGFGSPKLGVAEEKNTRCFCSGIGL